MDELWDDEAALLWTVKRGFHLVRETSCYALGLLQQGRSERAQHALAAVLDQQFDAPGRPFDGTFRRAPEEDDPPDDATMWIDYDPNWRQFIGTTFAVICDRHADLLSDELYDRLRASIAKSISSEDPARVSPSYTNIALMKAWLDGDEDLTRRIKFPFLEYNSPTYYGIDLWALALWRSTPGTFAELGSRLHQALWRDIARFYHAGLRNQCGPFDRAYGMDMTRYATPLGLYIWSALGPDFAPFPDPGTRFRHPHDLCFGPCIAEFDPEIPEDVVPDLCAFAGERTVETIVTDEPSRAATAWLSDDVMIGAWSGPPSGIGLLQHHHATIHWRTDDGDVAWLRVPPEIDVDAVASPGRLEISSADEVRFDVSPATDVPFKIERAASKVVIHVDA